MKLWTDEEMQERIEHVRKMLEDNREEFERRSKIANASVDWSKVGSWYCGGSDIKEKSGCQNYMYDRKTKKYFKITKEN